jgi:hypothetical protein
MKKHEVKKSEESVFTVAKGGFMNDKNVNFTKYFQ